MRKLRRFRPGAWDTLEGRVVLSRGWRPPLAEVAPQWRKSARLPGPSRTPIHLAPSAELNRVYDVFVADFRQAVQSYVDALASASTGFRTQSSILTAPYTPGSGLFTVADATEFGSLSPGAPLQLTAIQDGTPVGLYQVTGVVGSTLTGVLPYNVVTGGFGGPEAADMSLPPGVTLQAEVPADPTEVADVAAQFRINIVQRSLAMTQSLVTYFNRLPIELPKAPGPYREHRPRNAIQRFITERISGTDPSSLVQSLLAIPLPVSVGSAQTLYDSSAGTVIENSRQEVLEGVRLLFAGQDVLGLGTNSPTIPAE